jgi:hypothetical protein
MSLNSKIPLLLLASLAVGTPAVAGEVCPSRPQHALRFVDVFDGPPQDLATLIPDKARERSGYWQLGYVYDAGRIVTIRCKYDDGKKLDVKLTNRVERCDYRIDAKHALKLNCK